MCTQQKDVRMSVTIRVNGVIETAAYFRRVANGIVPEVAIPATKEYAETLRDKMIPREHFRSGRMRAMTKIANILNGTSVVVDVPYAETENQRKGNKRGRLGGGQGTPHRFVEPSMKEVEATQYNKIIVRLAQFLLSS